jgi:hypothetical protein
MGIIEQMKTSKTNWIIHTKEVVDTPGKGVDVYTQQQLDYLKINTKRLPDGEYLLRNISTFKPYESITVFNDDSIRTAKSNTYINSKWNNFKGWSCDVALESLVISWDGSITGSCQEPVFNTPFNMYSEDFLKTFKLDADFKSITCPRESCSCAPETHISKRLIS